MSAIPFLLRSTPWEVAGIALLGLLLLLLLQCGLDLFANIHGDFQSFSLAVNRENDLLAYGSGSHKADQFGAGHGLAVHRGDHISSLQTLSLIHI